MLVLYFVVEQLPYQPSVMHSLKYFALNFILGSVLFVITTASCSSKTEKRSEKRNDDLTFSFQKLLDDSLSKTAKLQNEYDVKALSGTFLMTH